MIRTEQIDAAYDGRRVVHDVSVDIEPGGVTCLVGPNGAGKSTLLSVIARLHSPESGVVTIDGMDVHTTASAEIAKRLAVLRQDNHLALRLTVSDLVSFGRFPYSKGRLNAQDREIVDSALERLDLQELADRFLDELSGGQRQRAFVAMVIAQNTDYVLLDEPLNNLDMKHSVHMMRLLRRAADDLGKTIVIVIHDINFASTYSDSIIAMKRGKIVAAGNSCDIMTTECLANIYDMDIRIIEVDGRRIGVYF